MSPLRRLARRLRALVHRPAVEHELDDELRFHLEMEMEKNQRAGMTAEFARRAALVAFGGVDRYKEEARDARGVRLLEKVGQDIGYGFRMVRKFPGFAAVVILTLALGVGANTAIFSVVNAVLLRPLPYAQAERLVIVYSQNPDRSLPRFSVSYADWLDWRRENRVFTDIAVTRSATMTIAGSGEPERLPAALVSDNYFAVLGVRPFLGQLFAPGSEARGGAGVVLSHGFWTRRFGADSAIIGKTIPLNGQAQVVAAVLPRRYRSFGSEPDVYGVLQPSSIPSVESHGQHMLVAIGRLRPDVSLEQANQDMRGIADRIGSAHPDVKGWSVNVFLLRDELTLGVRGPLLVLLAASAFVLLIACMNIANLQLTRGAARGRELAVRRALGASRGRLISQLLGESTVLALLGGVLGLGVAAAAMKLLLRLVPPGTVTRLDEIGLDARVLLFALVTSLATGVLFGLLPALRASDPELARSLREGGRRSGGSHAPRIRRALVMTEVSLALVLLVCAGLVLQSFRRITAVDPGFRAERVVTMQLSLGAGRYPDSLQFPFYRDLLTRLAARPGIQSAAAVNAPPLTGGGIVTGVRIMGMPPAADGSKLMSAVTAITPSYFQTMGVRLLRGRDVAWIDAAATLVVSESAARRFWPNVDPLGRRVGFGVRDTLGLEVVGVVSDVRIRNLTSDPDPVIYMLLSGATTIVRRTTLLVRGEGDVASITGTTKNVLRELDPTLPLFNIQPMADIVAQSVAQPKLNSTLLAIFAALALLLAAVGIYGVVSYSVAQRTHEMGLRMALGAPRSNVLGLVVKEGAVLAGAGVVIGLLASRLATSVIASWLFDIEPGDPLTYAAVGLLLVAIALLASYLPARRATRVDPVIAMRAE